MSRARPFESYAAHARRDYLAELAAVEDQAAASDLADLRASEEDAWTQLHELREAVRKVADRLDEAAQEAHEAPVEDIALGCGRLIGTVVGSVARLRAQLPVEPEAERA